MNDPVLKMLDDKIVANTANIEKLYEASVRQLEAITKLNVHISQLIESNSEVVRLVKTQDSRMDAQQKQIDALLPLMGQMTDQQKEVDRLLLVEARRAGVLMFLEWGVKLWPLWGVIAAFTVYYLQSQGLSINPPKVP